MQTLVILSRLAERKVTAKQKDIAKLGRLIDDMHARKAELLRAIEAETSTAARGNDPSLYLMAGNFLMRARSELEDLDEAIADAEKIMVRRQDEMRELYAEQKRYEILQRRKQDVVDREAAREIQRELDELGGRKQQSEF